MPDINLQEPPMNHKPFDPREQAVHPETRASVLAAIADNNAERSRIAAETGLQLPPIQQTEDDMRRLDGSEAVHRLVNEHGADRVQRWLRMAAMTLGQEIERPADRCLADGAALVNKLCVQCGRDNS